MSKYLELFIFVKNYHYIILIIILRIIVTREIYDEFMN